MKRKVKSQPPDAEDMESRADDARLRQMLGEPLSETDLRILQIEQNGFGCRACASAVAVGGHLVGRAAH